MNGRTDMSSMTHTEPPHITYIESEAQRPNLYIIHILASTADSHGAPGWEAVSYIYKSH